ncbi:MAG: hypothetical protein M5U19_07145 [Microthrixaceae bacterium]|nr:hypothetical protein [Microthrixaceae bacterium]
MHSRTDDQGDSAVPSFLSVQQLSKNYSTGSGLDADSGRYSQAPRSSCIAQRSWDSSVRTAPARAL